MYEFPTVAYETINFEQDNRIWIIFIFVNLIVLVIVAIVIYSILNIFTKKKLRKIFGPPEARSEQNIVRELLTPVYKSREIQCMKHPERGKKHFFVFFYSFI